MYVFDFFRFFVCNFSIAATPSNRLAHNLAIHHTFQQGVSRQAVVAVDSARDFSTSIQTSNRIAVLAKDTTLHIDRQTSHTVMQNRYYRSHEKFFVGCGNIDKKSFPKRILTLLGCFLVFLQSLFDLFCRTTNVLGNSLRALYLA